MTICRGLTEKEARPTEFAAPVNSGRLLVTWKRSKTFVSAKTKAMENKDRAIDDELKRFEATWRFVEIEVGGQKVPEKAFAKDTLILKGKTVRFVRRGQAGPRRIQDRPPGEAQDHRHHLHRRAGKGHSQKGIYELDGDTQKICIAMPDQPRPTEFVTSPENGHILEVFKARENVADMRSLLLFFGVTLVCNVAGAQWVRAAKRHHGSTARARRGRQECCLGKRDAGNLRADDRRRNHLACRHRAGRHQPRFP